MRQSAIRKEFFMEIKKSLNRFLSIMFIVAMGVSFFAGIRASEPDLRLSLDKYYDEHDLLDVRILSTMGLTDDDLAAILSLDEVKSAEATNTIDVLYDLDGNQKILKFISIYDTMNKSDLEQGSFPTKGNECVLDNTFAERNNLKIGDTIKIYLDSSLEEDGDKLSDTLKYDSYTITGFVSSSLYLAFQRGSSQIGQGEVSAFVFVPKSSFCCDYYSQIDIIADGSKEQTAYTTGYNDIVDNLKSVIESDVEDAQIQSRYDFIVSNAQVKVDDAKTELAKNQADLDNATKELSDNKAKLEESKVTLSEKKKEYEDGKITAQNQIASAKDQLSAAEAQLDEQSASLDNLKLLIDSGQVQYQEQYNLSAAQLDAARQELEAKKTELSAKEASTNKTLSESKAQLDEADQEIADNEQKLLDAQDEIDSANEKIADGQSKIDDAQKEVDDIEYPKWYINDRNDLPQYEQLGNNADSMKALGGVFPVIFFLVAALISLTTMTRMVEDERTQIGVLSALGYTKGKIAAKYLWYAGLATLMGSLLGGLIGEKLFPFVIIYAYQIMNPYVTDIVIPYHLSYWIMATVAAYACTMIATFSACFAELSSKPSMLMRPAPPKNGKRILLERITFLWKRFSFSTKSSLRNIFRYKRRFFMTVLGIGGCMALMLVGFGIRDSILEIVDIQYNELQQYDGMIHFDGEAADASTVSDNISSYLSSKENVDYYTGVYMESLTGGNSKGKMDCYLFVPDSTTELSNLIVFRTRVGHESLTLDDSGVIISEKLAKTLDITPGDTMTLTVDNEPYEVTVSGITEHYMYHYVYMTKAYYSKIFGKDSSDNTIIYLAGHNADDYKSVGEGALDIDGVLNVTYSSSTRSQLENMLTSLNLVIVVLVIAAGMLAFVVIYNLNNISINERIRELATLKVLGFYNGEVAFYIYRENIILTAIGCLFGILFGKLLHSYTITTVEIDSFMFGRNINPVSYLYSTLFTILFAIIVNFVMYFKIKRIDMIESLKNLE